MPYRLVAVKGPLRGRTFVVVKTETRLGRDTASDLVVPDEYVSRHHATIVTRGDRHVVVNASPNGTRVNGKRVERATLADGDEITLGATTVLRYETGASAPSPTKVAAEPGAPETAAAPRLAAGPPPFWRRRPKLVAGGLAYLLVLAALAAFLATRRTNRAPKEVPLLTHETIEHDLRRELVRDRDRLEAQRALTRAMDLYERRLVNPANLYAAIVAFKEAEAYLGSSLSRPEHIQAYEGAVAELTDTVDHLYFEALGLQRLGRYDEARDCFARILQYVNDPTSTIYQNVARRIEALQPFLEKKRWSGR